MVPAERSTSVARKINEVITAVHDLGGRVDGLSARIDARFDAMGVRIDTLIDAISDVRVELAQHRHDD